MKDVLHKLRYLLGPKASRQSILIFILMVFGAGFEAMGIGLIMPFLALVAAPEALNNYPLIISLSSWFGLNTHQEILFAVGAMFLGMYVFKNIYLYWMHHTQYKYVYANYVALTLRLLKAYLGAPYTFHVNQNSAELVRNLSIEISNIFYRTLISLFTLVVEGLVLLVIGGLLLFIEPLITVIALLSLGGAGASFYLFVRLRLLVYGKRQQLHASRMIKWINQGVGSIKETKVLGKELYFVEKFEESSQEYADSGRMMRLLQIAPRFFIETLSVGGILAVLLFMMAQERSIESILPTLGVFGLAAVRLMPSLTRLISALTVIRSSQPSLDLVTQDLRALSSSDADLFLAPGPKEELPFTKNLNIHELSFHYPDVKEPTLRGLNLSITHGESVAFVGASGSGKTTTVDLLLGLLEPSSGHVRIDGVDIHTALKTWQQRIGYIAQPTYLLDDTVRRNIAFGVPDALCDEERVWEAIKAAQLQEHIQRLPQGLDTVVGEHGARFSGGQRQRLGIARALYHRPDVLVLDEATSALDNETEREIVRTISELGGERTVITIAHRLSTVRHCDRIYFLSDGQVAQEGTFDELLESSEAFRRMAQAQIQQEESPS